MSRGNDQPIIHFVRQVLEVFRRNPNRLFALRITASLALLAVPFVIAGEPFWGITLSLGAVAAALSETDDHPRGRIKSMSITVLSFFVSSLAVGLLYSIPWVLGIGFILSTIVFILIGGIGERYRAITFGSILVGIYAMLGTETSPTWYWQAILLPAGALFHGLLSLLFMYLNPWRLLDEQIANGFRALASYLDKKALLFPSKEEDQGHINRELALLNIAVVNSMEKIKNVLNNYGREMKEQKPLHAYLQRFILLQSLHERAASSHERHDRLSESDEQKEILEGFGEMLRQLATACRMVALNRLTGARYHHPPALEWISEAISDRLKNMDPNTSQTLLLLHHNLHRSQLSLKFLDDLEKGTAVPRLKVDKRSPWERFKSQLSLKNPRMRYAIRLSLTFALGFLLERWLKLEKGEWVMLTSLFVSQISYSDTRRRLSQRLLGTATGIVLGAVLLQIFTTTAAQMLLLLGAALAFFYWLRTNYSVAVIFVTLFVLSAFSIISRDGGLQIMVPRLIDTLLGATLSFLTIRFLWPGWQFKRMPALISEAMEKNRLYLLAIQNEYHATSTDDLNYRIARREAHLADNELAQAWNSMRLEPRKKQQLIRSAFILTYLNHALLSHISALGAHRISSLPATGNFNEILDQIEGVLAKAGELLSGDPLKISGDLSPLLNDLRKQIELSEAGTARQQLRLLYNIADTTSKVAKELKKVRASGTLG